MLFIQQFYCDLFFLCLLTSCAWLSMAENQNQSYAQGPVSMKLFNRYEIIIEYA